MIQINLPAKRLAGAAAVPERRGRQNPENFPEYQGERSRAGEGAKVSRPSRTTDNIGAFAGVYRQGQRTDLELPGKRPEAGARHSAATACSSPSRPASLAALSACWSASISSGSRSMASVMPFLVGTRSSHSYRAPYRKVARRTRGRDTGFRLRTPSRARCGLSPTPRMIQNLAALAAHGGRDAGLHHVGQGV